MTALPICATCGTQFPAPSPNCPICEDERQFVAYGGQRWTALDTMRRTHANFWRRYEPDLYAVGTTPAFAINQRAFLVQTPAGNILWDCISLLDDATIDLISALGGLVGIAISHPHYYTTMVDWAHAFNAPVWLHEADRAHVMRPDPSLRFWSGATQPLLPGLTLINAPGHFAGGTVLHWNRGVLLCGDILQVVPDRSSVSFMRSYPNLIPLSAPIVRATAEILEPYAYDRVYGAFWDREILTEGKAKVARSFARYLHWISSDAKP